jgi:hypothetical protein
MFPKYRMKRLGEKDKQSCLWINSAGIVDNESEVNYLVQVTLDL